MAVDIPADQVHGTRDHHQLIALKRSATARSFYETGKATFQIGASFCFVGGGKLPAEMKRGIVFVLPDKLRGV